jgi:hemin uptake protein HemP
MSTPPSPSFHPLAKPGQRPCPQDAIPADLLFKGNQEILIAHNGETYRLRITRNGKLILTK